MFSVNIPIFIFQKYVRNEALRVEHFLLLVATKWIFLFLLFSDELLFSIDAIEVGVEEESHNDYVQVH